MLSKSEIIRAWKDPQFRESLSEAELASLPENPAGLVALSDEDLDSVAGGWFFSLFGCKSCLFNSCNETTNKAVALVEPMTVLLGVGGVDFDDVITPDELANMENALEQWSQNPVLSPAELEGINHAVQAFEAELSPEDFQSILPSIMELQERGTLTEADLEELAILIEMNR